MRRLPLSFILLLGLIAAGAGCRKQNGANGPTQTQPGRPAVEAPAPAAPKADDRPEENVARVGSLYVLGSELDDRLRVLSTGRKLDAAGADRVRRRALDELVERRLVTLAAQEAGITVADEELSRIVDESIASRGGPEGFALFLEKQGMTPEGWREENRFIALRKKLRDDRFPVEITEDDVAAYYDKYAKAGNKGEKVRVSRVFLPVGNDASEEQWKEAEQSLAAVKAEIEAGLAFAEAAKRSSGCPYARQGGDMGFATHARRPEDVFAPAFTMEVGQIAGPMRVTKGVQILTVTEKTEDKVGSLADEKENIRRVLEGQQRQRNTRKLTDQLQKQYRVEYFL